jgi:hypothetical protein
VINTLSKLTFPLICSAILFSGCGSAGTKGYSGQGSGTKITTSQGSKTTTNATSNYSSTYNTTQTTDNSGANGTSGTTGTSTTTTAHEPIGVTATVESMLQQHGIYGTKVLVLDDTVFLAQTGSTATRGTAPGSETHYNTDSLGSVSKNNAAGATPDPDSKTRLPNTTGTTGNTSYSNTTDSTLGTGNSGATQAQGLDYGGSDQARKIVDNTGTNQTGPSTTSGHLGTTQAGESSGAIMYGAPGSSYGHINLNVAKMQIQSVLGGVRVLSVSSPEAIQAMDRVKKQLKSATISNAAVSADISTIIKNAKAL